MTLLRQSRLFSTRGNARALRASAIGDLTSAAFDAVGPAVFRHGELTAREWVVLLLQTAAEVEHALLAQYLFASYSLIPGLAVPGSPRRTTSDWRVEVAEIAIQEMTHLLSLQNMLRALGGALHFERDDFPIISRFHPFPFELRPLGIESLANYIAAEMPAGTAIPEAVLTPQQLARIRELSGHGAVNRVGILYQTLQLAIDEVTDDDFRKDRDEWQELASDWEVDNDPDGSLDSRFVAEILPGSDPQRMKETLKKGIHFIAQQGEAPDAPDNGSHFEKFARIYRELDEAGAFTPSRKLARNPNTTEPPDPSDVLSPEEQQIEMHLAPGRIIADVTKVWAQLFNVRYRILLTSLAHSCESGPLELSGLKVQALLRKWAFDEMRSMGSLRSLSNILVELPLGGGSTEYAGPTFELPYTLTLPGRGPERWRLHRDLIDVTASLISRIRTLSTPTALQAAALKAILERDGETVADGRRSIIERVGGIDEA